MSRSCHNSYKTHHQQKGDRLFEATGSPFDYVVEFGSEMMSSVDCTVTPVTQNRPQLQSVASRKRSCTSSCKEHISFCCCKKTYVKQLHNFCIYRSELITKLGTSGSHKEHLGGEISFVGLPELVTVPRV